MNDRLRIQWGNAKYDENAQYPKHRGPSINFRELVMERYERTSIRVLLGKMLAAEVADQKNMQPMTSQLQQTSEHSGENVSKLHLAFCANLKYGGRKS